MTKNGPRRRKVTAPMLETEDRRHYGRRQDGEMKRYPEPHRQQRRRVGTDAEERHMAERKFTDVADDQVEARRQHHGEHDHDADVQGVLAVECQRRQHCQRERDKEEIALESHQARSARLLNSP